MEKDHTLDFNSIALRPPKISDSKAYTQFANSLTEEITPTHTNVRHKQKYTEDEIRLRLARITEKIKQKRMCTLFAFHNDQIIGVINIRRSQHQRIGHLGNLGILIKYDYRGKGLGSVLIREAIEEARKNLPQLRKITLTLSAENIPAYRLYQKNGFTEYGKLPEAVHHNGRFIDRIFMYKDI